MRPRCPRPAPATRLAFAGFRFRSDVIVLAVCWYLRFGLSYRDVAELLTKRDVEVDHVTVYRWGAAMFGSKLQDDRARSPCSQTGTDRDRDNHGSGPSLEADHMASRRSSGEFQ
jgi:hypothetical protein